MSSTMAVKPTYRRISKAAARKRLFSGLPISLCPVKLRPGGPFCSDVAVFPTAVPDLVWHVMALMNSGPISPERLEREAFDKLVRDFNWYNANSWETGYYPAYYVCE